MRSSATRSRASTIVRRDHTVKILDQTQKLDILTAPGGAFPLRDLEIDGVTLSTFDRDPYTLRDAFIAASTFGDRAAIAYEDERWTYDELWSSIATLAHILRTELGIGKGDRVGIAMRNYPEYVFIFGATQLLGAVAVPLNAWLKGPELAALIEEARPVALFADQERLAVLRDVDLAAAGTDTVVAVRATQLPDSVVDYHELASRMPARTDAPEADVTPDDLSTILFTSGTTGKPKAAAHNHRNHSASLLNKYIRAVGVEVPDGGGETIVTPPPASCKLVTFPFFHIAGINTMYNTIYSGQPIVLMYKWDPVKAVRLVETEKVNELSGPPFIARTFLDAVVESGGDVSSLRIIGMGGAAAPAHIIEQVRTVLGPTIVPRTGYGMTETTSGVVAISAGDFEQRPNSVGRTLPTAEIAIIDAQGIHLGADEVGEVIFRGPQVIQGYLGADNAGTFEGGWFHTGDLGRVDAEGFVYLVGRLKDIVIRGGENINCSEVEVCLESHDDVVEAVVLGAPHATLGEELVAVVRTRQGSPIEPEDLRAFVKEHLASFKVPARIAIIDGPLPRTPSGKIIKREVIPELDLQWLLEAAPEPAV
ncbi:MAG: AMP-dependent synthetase and ligase [Subtercola sp.]|nr:AMP-dependent synthetase and ligase [Subtercola sp.]